MDIKISFAEVSQYIKAHYDKTLTFSCVSDKEMCVSYSQNIFFKTIQVPVNIKIDEVNDSAVSLTYNGGFGIDMMIVGALAFMKSKLPELADVIVSRDGHQLSIELSRLPQARTLVENVRLKDIFIREDRFEIKAQLR